MYDPNSNILQSYSIPSSPSRNSQTSPLSNSEINDNLDSRIPQESLVNQQEQSGQNQTPSISLTQQRRLISQFYSSRTDLEEDTRSNIDLIDHDQEHEQGDNEVVGEDGNSPVLLEVDSSPNANAGETEPQASNRGQDQDSITNLLINNTNDIRSRFNHSSLFNTSNLFQTPQVVPIMPMTTPISLSSTQEGTSQSKPDAPKVVYKYRSRYGKSQESNSESRSYEYRGQQAQGQNQGQAQGHAQAQPQTQPHQPTANSIPQEESTISNLTVSSTSIANNQLITRLLDDVSIQMKAEEYHTLQEEETYQNIIDDLKVDIGNLKHSNWMLPSFKI